MSMMSENVVANIQEKLRQVYKTVTEELIPEMEENTMTQDEIKKTFERMPMEEKRNPGGTKSKLDFLYQTAIVEAEGEELTIKRALDAIYHIRSLINDRRIAMKASGHKETIRRGALMKLVLSAAQNMPLWIGKIGEKPPALCGATPADPNHVSRVGDMVAALIKTKGGEDNWILAEVLHYSPSQQKYEVDDIDEESKERISLSRRRVIPLPLMRANPVTSPEALYRRNSIVLALYPQTTCFYKGIVSQPPATHDDEYEVLFDDPTYPDGYSPPLKVAQRYVIPYTDKKTK